MTDELGSLPLDTDIASQDELDAAIEASQTADSDLAAIGALAPSDDSMIQRKSGVWVARSMAQVKADLALAKGDVGLGSVDNVQQMPLSYLDTDGTLAGNSDAKVASQKATKTYVDAAAGAPILPMKTLSTGLSYTYTYITGPSGSYPDGSFDKLNNLTVDAVSGNLTPVAFSVYDTGSGLWGCTGPPASGYTAPTYSSGTWGVMWQNSDPSIVLNLGSALRPSYIEVWGQRNSGSGVGAPARAYLRSADDSGMSTNLVTHYNVLLPHQPYDGYPYRMVFRIPTTATARRYWNIVYIHAVEWTALSEIGVFA